MIQGIGYAPAEATNAEHNVYQLIATLGEILLGERVAPHGAQAAVQRVAARVYARVNAGHFPAMTVADFKALTRAVGHSPDWF